MSSGNKTRDSTGAKAPDVAGVYLRQSALRLARLCRKHFKITGDGDALGVSDEVLPRDVSAFFDEYQAAIRPPGIGASKVLPEDSQRLRTFLWTRPVADAVLADVVRLSLYSDQVVIVDPFSKHVALGSFTPGERGPIREPTMWVQTVVNWGLLICALEPWVESDLVILIPEPSTFVPRAPNFEAMARRALADGMFTIEVTPGAIQDMLEAAALSAPGRDEVDALAALVLGDLDSEARAEVVDGLVSYQKANARRYVPSRPEHSALIAGGSGQNVFEASWIADAIGGYVAPRGAHHLELFRKVSRGPGGDGGDALAAAFVNAPVPMLNNVSLATALALRESGRLAAFRLYLRQVWSATASAGLTPKDPDRARALAEELVTQHAHASEEWSGIYKDLGVKGAVALFATPLAPIIQAGIIPAAATAIGIAYHGWSSGARALHRTPAAILVDLENESSPNPLRRLAARIERRG